MYYIAHRGNLAGPDKQNENTIESIRTALRAGFGIETDLRDRDGALVIAHDLPTASAPTFEGVLAEYLAVGGNSVIALNIKADGLRRRLSDRLWANQGFRYFCFDMSVPETIAYCRDGLRFFTRESEYESHPVLYKKAAGVWMDQFDSNWISPQRIKSHLNAGKEVALVSPDLHGRPHLPFWTTLKRADLGTADGLMLCSDYVSAAKKFFDE